MSTAVKTRFVDVFVAVLTAAVIAGSVQFLSADVQEKRISDLESASAKSAMDIEALRVQQAEMAGDIKEIKADVRWLRREKEAK